MGHDEQDAARKVYDEVAELYPELYAEVVRYDGRVRDFLAREARPGVRLLDLGCADGHHTAGLPASVSVVGLDLSPNMVAAARRRRPAGVYAVHDFHDPVPPGLGPFDAALSVGCFEFCRDPARVLGHLAHALRPGAPALVTFVERRAGLPGHEAPTFSVEASLDATLVVHLYTRDEVAEAARAAGLALEAAAFGVGWELNAPRRDVHYGFYTLRRG